MRNRHTKEDSRRDARHAEKQSIIIRRSSIQSSWQRVDSSRPSAPQQDRTPACCQTVPASWMLTTIKSLATAMPFVAVPSFCSPPSAKDNVVNHGLTRMVLP